MPKISFGRRARIYISAVGFADDGLVMVRRCKDINVNDEADVLTADTRDWTHKVNGQGPKEIAVEFARLIDADDSGEDVQLLKDSFDNGTVLYVVVTRNLKELACGKGVRLLANLFGWPEESPEGEAAKVALALRLYDPDVLPERIDTPYVQEDEVSLRRYILASFPATAEELHMLTSSDGTNFVEYGETEYDVPSLRDPRIIYDSTIGKYRMVYTSLAFSGGVIYGYAEAPVPTAAPFVFTKTADVDVTAAARSGAVWAPTWFFDPATATLHTTISLGTGTAAFSRYEQHPISADGSRWSDPVLITGTAIPTNVIDCQIFLHPDDGLYYMLGKDETTKYSFLVSSSSPFSGYDTLVKSGDWLGVGDYIEGFGIFPNDLGGWRILFDKYSPDTGMSFVDSTTRDFSTATWSALTTLAVGYKARNSGIVFKNGTPLVTGEQQTVTWTALKNYVNGSGQNFTASDGTSTSSAFSFDNAGLLRSCNDMADALRLQIESFAAVGAGNVRVAGTVLSGDTASGLIRHYKFDETSGSTANDVSGNASSGTLNGGASFSTTHAPLVSGNVGSLLLDGVNGYVSLPNSFLLGCTTGFSLSLWLNWSVASTWQYIFESFLAAKGMLITPKGSPGGVPRGICMVTSNGGDVETYTGVDCPTGSWQHLVFTLDGTNSKIYQNGKLKVTKANTFVPSVIGASTINQMGKSHYGDPFFNGYIDEARFYDYALSPSEVTLLAQGGDQIKNTITYAAGLGNVPQITIGGSLGSPAIAASVNTL